MKITIVGGGFGGVKAALELAKQPHADITLITENPHFQYYPALYSAATGHSHLEAWVPLSKIFHDIPNVTVVIDSIVTIDPNERFVMGITGKQYDYETVILALGTITTYFGIKGLDQYAYGIKSVAEVNSFKRHLYDEIGRDHELEKHYVVVGGGPTGVELAAALGQYIERLCQLFDVKQRRIHIDLVEAAPRVLPRMSKASSAVVQKRLEKLGINVHTGKSVQSQNAHELMVSGKPITSHTVIWTSGVANHPFYKANHDFFEFAPNGRVVVDEFMQARGNVYVIGDNAATPYTGLAQTALHDAIFVADNIKRQHHHKHRRPYKAVLPPSVIPVGENWAVFEWRWLRLHGWIGAVLRRAADAIGYHDILPLGQALGVWRAHRIEEDEYFAPFIPSATKKK